MAGGLLTLVVEFIFGMYRSFALLASFTGFLLVATLLAVTFINLLPHRWWGKVKVPSIPNRLRPWLFEAGLIIGFLFGWLRW